MPTHILRLIGIAAYALAHPALYGYHLASLNGVQDVAVCEEAAPGLMGMARLALKPCIQIDDAQFGFAVTIITLGGLCGSLAADWVIRRYGRNTTLRMAQVGLVLGGIGVGVAQGIWTLAVGRFLIGAASGLIMVSIPPFLSNLSHSPRAQKLLGTLHQISIGIGMIIAQTLSLLFSRPTGASILGAGTGTANRLQGRLNVTMTRELRYGSPFTSGASTSAGGPAWGLWRIELAVAVLAAIMLGVVGLWVDADDDRAVEDRTSISPTNGDEDGERRPLLSRPRSPISSRSPDHRQDRPLRERESGSELMTTRYGEETRDQQSGGQKGREAMGIREAFRGETRYGAIIVVVALCSQQITGISPVMFFSSKILKSTFGGSSKLVSLGMMAVGIPFNFLPGVLKLPSKPTLLISSSLTTLFALLLAIGLNTHSPTLAGVSVIGFVVGFSFGLAPVAWVVLGEVVPKEARTGVGSVGVGVNWGTNLILGSTFIPLQSILGAEGNVFYFFAALSGLAFTAIWASYAAYERQQRQLAVQRKDAVPG